MLVLSRKTNECVIIDGRITVKVIRVEGDIVKLGFDAPPEISVHRQEVYERILRSKAQAGGPVPSGAGYGKGHAPAPTASTTPPPTTPDTPPASSPSDAASPASPATPA